MTKSFILILKTIILFGFAPPTISALSLKPILYTKPISSKSLKTSSSTTKEHFNWSCSRRALISNVLVSAAITSQAPYSQAKIIEGQGSMIEINDPDTYSGLVYVPKSASNNNVKKLPILFVLHGAGKNEKDVWNLANINGEHAGLIPSLLASGQAPPELYENFIVVAPYSKDKASFYDEPRSKLLQFMKFAISADGGGAQGVDVNSIDLDRKFLFGFSDGATLGVEIMTTRKFAGGVFAAYGFTGKLPKLALERLKGLPMWIFHSADDGTCMSFYCILNMQDRHAQCAFISYLTIIFFR